MTGSPESPLAQARQAADLMPIEEIDVSVAARFANETAGPYFARLRRDDPVHWCPDNAYGPYWSITRRADLMAVERDFERFSSAGNVLINDVPAEFDAPAFATADPPLKTAVGATSPWVRIPRSPLLNCGYVPQRMAWAHPARLERTQNGRSRSCPPSPSMRASPQQCNHPLGLVPVGDPPDVLVCLLRDRPRQGNPQDTSSSAPQPRWRRAVRVLGLDTGHG